MAAQLIPGKEIAETIVTGVRETVTQMVAGGYTPKLTAIQVGENAASAVYVKAQETNCRKVGIGYELKSLPAETTEGELLAFLDGLNGDSTVTGIILQLPLPSQIDMRRIQARITPAKDVEGVNPANMGMIVYGNAALAPCTALAARECIAHTQVKLYGKEVVVVGHSEIVGKPVALLMLEQFATTTVCHIATGQRGTLEGHVRRAEVLVVAVGKAGLIKGEWVARGAIVIDVGINRIKETGPDGQPVFDEKGRQKTRIVGDVEFDRARERASWITPVPGGVGSVTTSILLRNVVNAAKLQIG